MLAFAFVLRVDLTRDYLGQFLYYEILHQETDEKRENKKLAPYDDNIMYETGDDQDFAVELLMMILKYTDKAARLLHLGRMKHRNAKQRVEMHRLIKFFKERKGEFAIEGTRSLGFAAFRFYKTKID
jgi:hypothetical protein